MNIIQAQSTADLEEILVLQQANLPHNISQQEATEQGFMENFLNILVQ